MGRATIASWNRRLIYAIGAGSVLVLGVASRRYAEHLPSLVAEYGGDTLWAAMTFLGVSLLFPETRLSGRVLIAISFAVGMEVSQLCKASWLEAIRATTLGGLVLGFDFVWTDLVCYVVGVSAAALLEALANSWHRINGKGPWDHA